MGTNFAGINLPTASTITPMTQKLSERVRWVLDNVDISESAWSEGAEMSRGYIQKLKNRDAKRPEREALARRQGEYVDLLGVDVVPVEDGGRKGALILMPTRDERWANLG